MPFQISLPLPLLFLSISPSGPLSYVCWVASRNNSRRAGEVFKRALSTLTSPYSFASVAKIQETILAGERDICIPIFEDDKPALLPFFSVNLAFW